MTKTTPEQNKALVLEAFESLFNTEGKADLAGGVVEQPPDCR
jgi:hypothetical protein